MISLRDMRGMYNGRACAVLGGGPSLPGDLARVRAYYPDALLLAVNHHALPHCDPDMMLFVDEPFLKQLGEGVRAFKKLKICPHVDHSDVDMRGVDYWNGPGASPVATWMACYMECNPVLLCGMDCYQGDVMYCHEDEGHKAIFDRTLESILMDWKRGIRRCPHVERVRAVSGPLVEIFGEW